MRHKQFTLKASDVHKHARRLLLAELDLSSYKPTLPPALVVSLLLLASLWQTSLSAACGMVKDPPCRAGPPSCSLPCSAPCTTPCPITCACCRRSWPWTCTSAPSTAKRRPGAA